LDGNLVLYQNPDRPGVARKAFWASNTAYSTLGTTIMQNDGNLVVYDRMNKPVYSSSTSGYPGSRLVVQDDGNVVIYLPSGRAIWATNTRQK
jgi:NTE family protein